MLKRRNNYISNKYIKKQTKMTTKKLNIVLEATKVQLNLNQENKR